VRARIPSAVVLLLLLALLGPSAQALPVWRLSLSAPDHALPSTLILVEGDFRAAVVAGAPLQNVAITLEGTLVATRTTNVFGDYSANVRAPDQRGAYEIVGRVTTGPFAGTESPVEIVRVAVPATAPTEFVLTTEPLREVVHVTWQPPFDNGGTPIWGYDIYRNGELRTALPASARSWDDTSVKFGSTYSYHALARTAMGNGAPTASATATIPTSSVQLTGQAYRLIGCIPSGAHEQCVIATQSQSIYYEAEAIRLDSHVQGRLLRPDGTPMAGYLISIVVNASWDGELRKTTTKQVSTTPTGYVDTIVWNAASWNELPLGSCRTVDLHVDLRFHDGFAQHGHSWEVCHGLTAGGDTSAVPWRP